MTTCYGNSLVGTSGINGDRFYISPDCSTIMLADGASGAGADGKVAMSTLCVETVESNPFCESGLSPEGYIREIVWKINNELINMSQQKNKYIFGTLIICIIENNTATIAAIGDSPAFLIRGKKVERVAKPKKTYDNLVQMGVFAEEQLEEYVHRLPEHMWSMFETFIPMVVPEYSVEEYSLLDGDMIAVCCDGVSDYLNTEELLQLIESNDLTKSVNAIIAEARDKAIKAHQKNKHDDITIVLYQH